MDLNVALEATEHLLASVAIGGGGWWFWYTTRYKPRLQLEIEFSSWPVTSEIMIGEIRIIFENKGFVEHKFYNLHVSARGSNFDKIDESGRFIFEKELMPRRVIKPEEFGINFVRPGVCQTITIPFYFNNQERTVRITCRFGYTKHQSTLHAYRRFFHVPPGSNINSPLDS